MTLRSLLVLVSCLAVSACTSIKSSYLDSPREGGGLIYFMPSKDLLVSFEVIDRAKANHTAVLTSLKSKRNELLALRVSVPDPLYLKPIDDEIANIDAQIAALAVPPPPPVPPALPAPPQFTAKVVSIAVSDTYPDTTKGFSLHPGLNHFGKNKLDVTISNKGLLSKAQSKIESQFTEAITNLASSAGAGAARRTIMAVPVAATDVCPAEGKYLLRYKFADFKWVSKVVGGVSTQFLTASESVLCAGTTFTLNIDKLWKTSVRNGPECDYSGVPTKKCKNESGLFYRQPLPYLVNVSEGASAQLTTTVYSPSESPINMLPIKRSFFADSDTNFDFNEGVPTKFTEVSDGELVSLLKLPADIISAYFGAIGSTFDAFKTADNSEAEFLKNSLELDLSRKKVKACSEAIQQGDEDEIIALKCSE